MADKKSKIGGISKFANFGGGSKTSENESERTSGLEETKTQEIQDLQTSTSADRKDTETYEHFNGNEAWSEGMRTQGQQSAYVSVYQHDRQTVKGGDGTLLPSELQDIPSSITPRQKDLQTSIAQNAIRSTHKDVTDPQLQNVSEQLIQDEQTSKHTDSQKKKSARSPEKEEGRQTIYFSDPEQRRILQALKFLERRDISEIVSDALDLYVEHSPFKAVLPAVLAAQEGKFTGE